MSYTAEDLGLSPDIANTTILDKPCDELRALLLEQNADHDPTQQASRKRYINKTLTTKIHIIFIILPKIFQAFPSQFRSLIAALEFAWAVLVADCRRLYSGVNP